METPVSPPPAARDEVLAISPGRFRRVAAFITRELGIRMNPAKIPLLQSRLQRRVRARGYARLESYLEAVLEAPNNEDEVLEFIDAVTTNKTDFFREPQHFEYLQHVVLPALDPGADRGWTLRMWSAGCSSGPEAYTLAMLAHEFGAARDGFDYEILGTDVSRHVLQTASTAIYETALVEPVPPGLRYKYFLRSRDAGRRQVRVAPELRAHVRFQRLNFMSPHYDVAGIFDVIFFRNVMIYFDKPTQEQVVNRLCERLRPGGYLFVGHSESLTGLSVPLEPTGLSVYCKG